MIVVKAGKIRYTSFRRKNLFRQKMIFLSLLFSISLFMPSVSFAATYYLDAVNGGDSNPGTSSQPWKTLSKTQSEASQGDTVYLRSGNYGAFVDKTSARADWIIYKADTGHIPVFSSMDIGGSTSTNKYLRFEGITIQSQEDLGNNHLIDIDRCNYIKFIDCNIIGGGYDVNDHGHGVWIYHSANIEIDGCKIYGDGDGDEPRMAFPYGIYGRFSHYITITDCEIQECGHAIVAWGTNWIVARNEIHDIQVDGFDGASLGDSVFEDNQVYDIRRPFDAGAEIHNDCFQLYYVGGIYPGDAEYVVMENIICRRNIMYNSGGQIMLWGFSGDKTCNNLTIENNLMYNSGLDAVGAHEVHVSGNATFSFVNNTVIGNTIFRAGSVITRMQNNVLDLVDLYTAAPDSVSISNEDYNIVRTWWVHMAGYEQGEHTVELGDEDLYKALFADYDSNDFRLKEGCRAIDFGNPENYPNSDILGNSRDFSPDAGCYEYTSSTPDSTPPSKPQNLTALVISESQINLSWRESTDPESGISYYKIYRDGSQIDTSLTNSYSDTNLSPGTTYTYEISAVNSQSLESEKSATVQTETLSDTTDTIPPSVVSVDASESSVEVLFNESLNQATAENMGNYAVSDGISINSVSIITGHYGVTISTTSHIQNVVYTLTVTGIKDTAGNAMSETSIDYIYNNGLVGFWRFDDGSGNTAEDSSGYGNTGILINGPKWTEGKINGALSFDGIDDYVEIGTGDILPPWTASFWLKREDSDNTNAVLLESSSYSIKLEQYSNTNKIGFTEYGVADYSFNYEAPIGTWTHIVFVGTSTETMLYVDGVLTDTVSNSISCPMNQISSASSRSAKGVIDDVRIYNRALSADEVLNLFNEAGSLAFEPIGDKQVDADSTLTFEVITPDPAKQLYIEADSNLPFDPDVVFVNKVLSWTPTSDDVGSYEVTFVAPRGQYEDFETITITVNNISINQAPVLGAIGNKSVNEGSTLSFSVNATDPDGDSITYSAQNLPSGATFSGSTFSWTPGSGKAGSYGVTFVASDGQLQDSETITITVKGTEATIYEAEDADFYKCVKSSTFSGYTGTGYVDYISSSSSYIEWTVSMAIAGQYELRFRYALGNGTCPLEIKVNGQVSQSKLSFASTGSWSSWSTVSVMANLNAGSNKVRATVTGSSGPNIDHLRVVSLSATSDPPASDPPASDPPASDTPVSDTMAPVPNPMTWTIEPHATGSNSISMTATTASDSSGAEYYFECTSGGGHSSGWQDSPTYEDSGLSAGSQYSYRVKARDKSSNRNETGYSVTCSVTTTTAPQAPSGNFYEAENADFYKCVNSSTFSGYTGTGYVDYISSRNSYIEWTVNVATAGQYELRFRYAEGGSASNLEIRVNGQTVQSGLSFASTGSWSSWSTVSVMANLNAGSNKVRATVTGSSGPNIDYLQVISSY